MKTLYIVRHAKSSWDNPSLRDFDRPLNSRGERDAPEMGKRLAKKNIFPDLLLSSAAKRAYDTATHISRQLGYSKKDIEINERLYLADSEQLLHIIRKQANKNNTIMLFGHNPGLTDLANFFITETIDNIPTGGAVALLFHTNDWKEITNCKVTMLFFDYPKNILPNNS